jgi:hypothetical protein
MIPQQRIFRTQALQQYARSREKTVLPRIVAPPVFLCCWLLLGLLFLATVLIWRVHTPVYAVVFGALVKQHPASHQAAGGLEVVIFVPATPAPEIQVGDSITLQVVLTRQNLRGTIAEAIPGVMTPDEARQRYALTGDLALVIRQPSVVFRVSLGSTLPPGVVPGSSVSAQMRVGSQSILSLLPMLLQGFLGD